LLDPEDYRDILREYQRSCAGLLEFYGGHVAQYLGDGILAYFGYPVAHEDDAVRGVNAGLSIVNDAPQRLKGIFGAVVDHDLAIRVGIHTGTVITGEVGGGATREHLALGSAPNVAARLQGLAGKNEVVVSVDTQNLVSHEFLFTDLGLKSLKGISQDIAVFRVAGRRTDTEPQASGKELARLVGRESELEQLAACWGKAQKGQGQLVYLIGEPGIGKSTLLSAFERLTEGTRGQEFLLRGSPYHQGNAFHPIAEMFLGWIPSNDDLTADSKSDLLWDALHAGSPSIGTAANLVLDLLGLPLRDPDLFEKMSANDRRTGLKEACIAVVKDATTLGPVLFLVEDAHWLDPSSMELLSELTQDSTEEAFMMIVTSRPEKSSNWGLLSTGPQLTNLNLGNFSARDSEQIILELTGGKPLPRLLRDHLVQQTSGNPLFIKQLWRSLLDSGLVVEKPGAYELSGPISRDSIPTTLQASLMARLDRLGKAKRLAGLAATAGPEFDLHVLKAVSQLDSDEFERQWAKLLEADLVMEFGSSRDQRFAFTHGLIRDAAYSSLLRRTRRDYHRRFAEELSSDHRFSQSAHMALEVLAIHFTEAGMYEQAIPLWQKAGEEAIARSASVEAGDHFRKAIGLLESAYSVPTAGGDPLSKVGQPDTWALANLELDLRLGLAVALFATLGPASPESVATYERARSLCALIDENERLSPVLIGLWLAKLGNMDLEAAAELAHSSLELAISQADSTAELYAWIALGNTAYYMGQFQEAARHLDRAQTICDQIDKTAFSLRYGLDPEVQMLMFQMHSLWFLGKETLARAKSAQLQEHVLNTDNILNRAIALQAETIHQHHRRDVGRLQATVEKLIDIASAENLTLFLGSGLMYRGWVAGMLGEHEAGLHDVETGFYDHLKPASGDVAHSFHCLLSAEVNCVAGNVQEGMDITEKGIEFAQRHRDLTYASDLYRVRGDLLNLAGRDEQARSAYLQAIDIAIGQSAPIVELRARYRLAQLARAEGENQDNEQRLAALFDSVDEGICAAEYRVIQTYLSTVAIPSEAQQ